MKKLIPGFLILVILCGCGSKQATLTQEPVEPPAQTMMQEELKPTEPQDVPSQIEETAEVLSAKQSQTEESAKEAEKTKTEEPKEHKTTCSLGISCKSIAENPERIKQEKRGLIPTDGEILPHTVVEFTEGDSVFDVLNRIARERKIHFEFVETPMYHSAYVQGINNIYEFDCGGTSGWVYKVNGKLPSCGISQYIVKDGDCIEFYYSISQ